MKEIYDVSTVEAELYFFINWSCREGKQKEFSGLKKQQLQGLQ